MNKHWYWYLSIFLHVAAITYFVSGSQVEETATLIEQSVDIAVDSFEEKVKQVIKPRKIIKKPLEDLNEDVPPQQIAEDSKVNAFKATYFDYLTSRLNKNKSYPLKAKRLGDEGKTLLSIEIFKNGQLKSLKLKESSESRVLDQASLDLVKKALPFKSLPEGYNDLRVEIPIEWSL